MKDFFESELIFFIYWQERTVDVRILFVAVNDKGDDIFFSIFIGYKAIDVLCPLLYFWHSSDMPIAILTFKIHLLIAKGKLTHSLRRASKDEIHYCTKARLCKSLVGVFYAT